MDEHSLRSLILSAEQHDTTLPTMELLPTEGKLFAVDVAKVKVREVEPLLTVQQHFHIQELAQRVTRCCTQNGTLSQ